MKITSLDRNIREILETGYYVIPRFQRPFSWEKEQVTEFWEDLNSDEEPDYFIGSMVVYTVRDGVFGIVDGQQRLTTVTMILCALRNAFDKQGFSEQAKGIHALVERFNINYEKEYVLQSETSYPYLQEHIQKFGEPDIPESSSDEEQLLKLAFQIISFNINEVINLIQKDRSINEENKKKTIQTKLAQIRTKVLGLKAIYITLDSEEDAYVIFETLNSRGKDLNIADLIKNHLLRLTKPSNANVDLTKEKWNKIVEMMDSINIGVDEFLYHHWLSKYEKYVPAKRLFKSVKRLIKASNAKDFLEQLYSDAGVYRSIFDITSKNWNKNDWDLRDCLKAISIFRVKQPIPMILAVLREYEAGNLKKKHTKETLEAIEKFHFIFSAVTSQRSSGGISFMYATHAIRLTSSTTQDERLSTLRSLKDELRKRLPSYQEFEVNFAEIGYSDKFDKQKRLVQYILARLSSDQDNDLPIDYEQMTIEHLYPQKPKFDPPLDTELVSQLGNLILVTAEMNGELGNKPFSQKKEILNGSRIKQDHILANATKWSAVEIKERTKALASNAYNYVWKL